MVVWFFENSHKKKLNYKKLSLNKYPTYPEINKFKNNEKYNFVGDIGDVIFVNMNTLHKSGKNTSIDLDLQLLVDLLAQKKKFCAI